MQRLGDLNKGRSLFAALKNLGSDLPEAIELITGNARVILHRAREQFADLLVDEVQQSLDTTDVGRIREELTDLNLLAYCKPALERRA